MVESHRESSLNSQAFTYFWLLFLLISASTCHAVIHSGALNEDRPPVAGGAVTAATGLADAAGLPVVGSSRRFLCDNNSTDSNKRDSTKNTPVTNASQSDGGSNRTSAFTGSSAVRNSKDEGGNQVAAREEKGSSARADGESKGENVGNGTDAGKSTKGERHDSSQSDGREERKEEEREENNEKNDGEESEKKETRGKSDNGNTHGSSRERKEDGKIGDATKGGENREESKSRESFGGKDSSKEGEDHTKCNDSGGNSSEESSTSGGSGSGTDVSLEGRLGGWSGGAGGNEKLSSSLVALLADALIRLTASARIRIDGQGLDLGRRAGQQGSSLKPISTSGHSPARSTDQVLANPLMAVNLFVFNEPIEISAVHSFENKGSVSLQTQLALTTALARDNATVTQAHPQNQESGLGRSQDQQGSNTDQNASQGNDGAGLPPLSAAPRMAPPAASSSRPRDGATNSSVP